MPGAGSSYNRFGSSFSKGNLNSKGCWRNQAITRFEELAGRVIECNRDFANSDDPDSFSICCWQVLREQLADGIQLLGR